MKFTTVARCLQELGYSLQANVKTIEDRQHPDRDAQFRYLNEEVRHFVRRHDPVVSVDTKTSTISQPRAWARPSPTGPTT